MELFTASCRQQEEFRAYEEGLERLEQTLAPLAPAEDRAKIHALGEKFARQVEDFFQENRRLNIGVVGQVKAGKSSFLNTLLFQGRPILPKAATPKTAALTRIVYAPRNCLHIRYLTAEDWEEVLEEARADGEEDSAARELAEMVERRRPLGLIPEKKLGTTEEIPCPSVEALEGMLNDYVGEDGLYTPLVESVTLEMDREELRELSIVDTPGLNDPVTSRTDQTKKFLEICDVVFFLSQSGSFLDSSDWLLLSEQLPCQGVKRMILVASKADSALLDLLRANHRGRGADPLGSFGGLRGVPKAMTLEQTLEEVHQKLGQRARREVQRFGARPGGTESTAYRVLSTCADPYPVSALVENMRVKDQTDYNREEAHIYQLLEPHFQNRERDMERLGNFAAVREVFAQSVREKETIFLEKGRELVPTAREALRVQLEHLHHSALLRRDILTNGDCETLQQRLSHMRRQDNALRGAVQVAFGEASSRLETEKSMAISQVRALAQDCTKLQEHTGTKEHTRTTVSYRHHFLWWRWGREEHVYTYTTHYRYLLASDAAEQLRSYADKVASGFEGVFRQAIQLQELKRKLLNAVVTSLDASDETFDAGLCKQLAEEVIQGFSFPVLSLSFEEECRAISARFKGEITAAGERQAFSEVFANAISQVLERSIHTMEEQIRLFRRALDEAGSRFSDDILAGLQAEYQSLIGQIQDKQRQIDQIQAYITCLEQLPEYGGK